MKLAFLTSTLAAGIFAVSAVTAVPASANSGALSAGLSVNNGRVAGHLVLADHDRPVLRRHGPRGHGRFGRCETWRFAHRKLHRRFEHLRLLRTVHNRRGDRIFIAHARSYRGGPVRVRYNACLGRVMAVTPLRGHRHGHGDHYDDGHRRGGRR